MTLPKPRTAAECLQIVRLQPHEQAMLVERIEQYAGRCAVMARHMAIEECTAVARRILNAPLTEAELGETGP